jgi:putative tricarboxylic transport membrane protein
MTKRLAEFLILGGCVVLAVLLYSSTASYPAWVQGSTASYVRFLAVSLGALCILELLFWYKNQGKGKSGNMELTATPVRFWGLLCLLVAYSTTLTYLGFYLSSAAFLPAGMYLLGSRNPVSIGLTSGGVLLFIYLVFAKLLEVHLPESSLF